MKRFVTVSLVIFLASFGVVRAADEPVDLERALVRQAPKIIKQLEAKGYKNVGVLKFLVVKDGGQFSDNVGTLNQNLANRLEMSLLLANNARSPIGIIENASAVAAKTPGANHLNKEGRLRLFEPSYPLSWGKDKVKADAFISGLVKIGADLKTLTLSIFIFDAKENKLVELEKNLVVKNRSNLLGEMGESFNVRGAFDDGSIDSGKKQDKVIEVAKKVKEKEGGLHPAVDPGAPVRLEIRYNNEVVALEPRDGKVFVREPLEGQKVTLTLSRDKTKERYAVCVKINGENSLERQKLPDAECRKWVLDPGNAPVEMIGYQITDDKVEKFRVLSATESKAKEVNYGADVGTITVTVFRESNKPIRPKDLTDETKDTTIVEKAKLPEKKPDDFDSLKSALFEEANRGVLEGGEVVDGKVIRVKFNFDPTPIMSITVVYYQK